MPPLIAVLIPIALLAFWAWMFSDMAKNPELPYCFITLTSNNDPRLDWNVAFIVLNIAAAVYYYVNVYQHGR